MGDHEVFENKDDAKQSEEQRERIIGAFGELHQTIGERASESDRERVQKIREAMLSEDRSRLTEHITAAKTESSWLYDELMKHPAISSILRELSIMGF